MDILPGLRCLHQTRGDSGSGTILGPAQPISDDEQICYVQNVLVNPEYHRRVVGRPLVEDLVWRYSHCCFLLLSTDHASSQEGGRNHAFYRSLCFASYEEK